MTKQRSPHKAFECGKCGAEMNSAEAVMSKWQTWLCEKCGVSHAMNETKCFHCSHPKPTPPPGEQQGFPPRLFIGESCDEWSLSKPEEEHFQEYVSIEESTALLAEAVREAQERIARTEFSLKVAMVTDDERVRAAKLEVFVREIANAPFTIDAFRYWRHQAVLLTHLKAASTEGGKGGAALRSTPVKEEDKP